MPLRNWLSAFMVLLLLPFSPAMATGTDDDVSLESASPYVYIVSPSGSESYSSANSLTVQVEGGNIALIDIRLSLADQTMEYEGEGDSISHTFTFDQPQTQSATLFVRGYTDVSKTSAYAEQTVKVLSPKEELIDRMIALAAANSQDSRYQFAPAETDTDIGVCKNFVMRLFDTYSAGYRMLAYQELALHMPKNNSKKDCAPYDYGIEWRPETAEDGSPFEIAAQFKYNDALTEEENADLARNLLVQIQKGDFLQIVGYYGGGNGPHSLFVIRDYDPVTQMIHWTDSNMRGKRIDGVRWGYLQFDADADVEWWVNVFNRKKRGATLYRLRDDLYRYSETE
ncbi:MAG: hypothetical protein PHY64_07095 [Eubacteriales bacterium]|nr:hypothetical protein [Eubacteriales bacterium]